MLKQLTKLKLGAPFQAKVARITKNDTGRVIFYFEGGVPTASYATDTTTGKEMLKAVKDAYGAEKLADFKGEMVWVTVTRKNGFTNTSILTVLFEEEEVNVSSAFEVVDE